MVGIIYLKCGKKIDLKGFHHKHTHTHTHTHTHERAMFRAPWSMIYNFVFYKIRFLGQIFKKSLYQTKLSIYIKGLFRGFDLQICVMNLFLEGVF